MVPVRPVPVAVVGVSALFPGSLNAGGFWRDIVAGRDLVTDVPPTHWLIDDYYDADPAAPDKTYAKRGAFLRDTPFDPMAWGVPPSIVPATDTTQLLSLILARQVLDDASGGQFASMDKDRISVILGVTGAQELLGTMVSRLQRPNWVKGLREAGLPEDEVQKACDKISGTYVPWQESSFPGLLGNVVAGRIANRLDLGGTNCVTDAACASSFSALSMGLNELYLGQSDLVITGGCDTMNDIFMYMCFSKTPALSPSGDCKPFSDQADGTLLGEGIGMFAIKRLDDAERDGDRVYAVIKSVGSSSDGRAKSVYAPVPSGQAKALRRAYAAAGFGPETVELVEAHGTGTKAGDAAEFEGLCTAFDESGRSQRQWCSLGSVKSQIGHTKAAAGAAGFFKAVMALHHRTLPPTVKVERPNPKLHIETSPFHLNTVARPWVRSATHPRRAGVSSFGFGGSNFHVVVEEYTGPGAHALRHRTSPDELVLVSGSSPADVATQARALIARAICEGMLTRLAFETASTFDSTAPARLAVVAESEKDLVNKLTTAIDIVGKHMRFVAPTGIWWQTGAQSGPIAFLFPGQGSQCVGMVTDLSMAFDEVRAPFDAIADSLALHTIVWPQPVFDDASRAAQEDVLRETHNAQPAIGAVSLGLLDLATRLGLKPAAVAGHSFGEVVALHVAGVIDRDAVIPVARARGERMRDAAVATPGAMTAVPLPVADLEPHLKAVPGVVIANHNGPRQAVLSGTVPAIDAIEKRLLAAGIEPKRLPVATAFHSAVVAQATVPFTADLAAWDFHAPKIPVWGNGEAKPYGNDPAAARTALGGQLAKSVRFVEIIEGMYASGIRTFVEVGPGHVLTNLVGEILEGREHVATSFDRRKRNGWTSLHHAVGRLATAGVSLKLTELWVGFGVPSDTAAIPASKVNIPLNGANVGKPYPPPAGPSARPKPNPPRKVPEPVVIVKEVVKTVVAAASAAPLTTDLGVPMSTDASWLLAWQETQRTTAEAHAAFQRAMSDAHLAYLRTMEQSLVGLTGAPTSAPIYASVAAIPEPLILTTRAPDVVGRVQSGLDLFAPSVPFAAPVPIPAQAPSARPPVDLASTLFAVIAEKTGYPAEMLGLHMQLEADLGVDSIKRVEILSALRERAPGLPEVDPGEMARLETLGQIVEKLGAVAGNKALAPVAAPKVAVDLASTLFAVIAEKTGYPAEMLGLHMHLESDLGVDSIKRVEILSALRERAPGLPEVDPGEMARLETLGQIVEKLGAVGGPAPVVAPPAADLASVLFAVIADKTGYPAEMLGLHMHLESDLGVDSIKRVEILSALRERAPGLPEVDPGEMARLETLGQIVEKLGNVTGAPTQSASKAPVATTPATPQTIDRWAVHAVPAAARGLGNPSLAGGTRIAVLGHDQVGPALVAAFERAGLVASYNDTVPADVDALVLLHGLGDVSQADALLETAFQAAHAAAGRMSVSGGLFVTVQDTGGDFGLSGAGDRAWLGGLPGLVKTALIEWPVAGKAIDIDASARDANAVATLIADELLQGGPDVEVGFRADGTRLILDNVATPTVPGAQRVGKGDVVVVSGGARGVTAATMIALAAATQAHFVLLGRTPLSDEPANLRSATDGAALQKALLSDAKARGDAVKPADLRRAADAVLAGREVRSTLAAIDAAGGKATYMAVDVGDNTAVRNALRTVRDLGRIRGLVHGAGVLADKTIAEQTLAQWRTVLGTKVGGLRVLLDATRDDDLSLVLLFSSVAGRAGNAGQVAYSTANEVLNKVAAAEAKRRPQAIVRALGWGPWKGGMVTPALEAHFASLGVPLIPLDAGANALVAEAADGSPVTEVVLGAAPTLGAIALHGDRALAVGVHANRDSHSYLASHCIAGVPVVPVALVVEWFARAAQAARPDRALLQLTNVAVKRGVKLKGFENGGDWLTVRVAGTGDTASLELRGADGALHYTAAANFGDAPAKAPAKAHPPALGPWARDTVYDGHVLFHGPDFHVIRDLHGVGPEGISATVVGLRALGWADEPWQSDPAAVDGGLQLALLWGREVLGGATLPMSVASVHRYVDGPADGPLTAVLTGTKKSRDRAVADVRFTDAAGRIHSELRGVELILRPGEVVADA